MKKIILLIFAVFLSLTFVSAKNIQTDFVVFGLKEDIKMSFYYDIPEYSLYFRDYDVSLTGLKTNENSLINDDKNTNLSFKAQLLDNNKFLIYETYFEPSFVILSDPPSRTNISFMSLNMPYSRYAKYLRVFYKDTVKLEGDISMLLCNNNLSCDSKIGENYLSCSDCKNYDNDEMCFGFSGDKYCDLDCYNDSDCYKINCNIINNSNQDYCAETCYDKKKNNNETGIDCGKVCLKECVKGLYVEPEENYIIVKGLKNYQIKADITCNGNCANVNSKLVLSSSNSTRLIDSILKLFNSFSVFVGKMTGFAVSSTPEMTKTCGNMQDSICSLSWNIKPTSYGVYNAYINASSSSQTISSENIKIVVNK